MKIEVNEPCTKPETALGNLAADRGYIAVATIGDEVCYWIKTERGWVCIHDLRGSIQCGDPTAGAITWPARLLEPGSTITLTGVNE